MEEEERKKGKIKKITQILFWDCRPGGLWGKLFIAHNLSISIPYIIYKQIMHSIIVNYTY